MREAKSKKIARKQKLYLSVNIFYKAKSSKGQTELKTENSEINEIKLKQLTTLLKKSRAEQRRQAATATAKRAKTDGQKSASPGQSRVTQRVEPLNEIVQKENKR